MLASLTMATDDVNFGKLIFFLLLLCSRSGRDKDLEHFFSLLFFQYVSFLLLYIIIFTLLFLSPNYCVTYPMVNTTRPDLGSGQSSVCIIVSL